MSEIPVRTTESWNDAIEALLATAHWLYARKSYRHAEAAFRAALLYAWNDERAWLGFGACREAAGRREAALSIYATACAVCEPGVRVRLARGRLLAAVGRRTEAAGCFQEAHERAANSGDDWLVSLVSAERGAVA